MNMTDRGPAMEYVPVAQRHALAGEKSKGKAVLTPELPVPARAVVAEEQAVIEAMVWVFHGRYSCLLQQRKPLAR